MANIKNLNKAILKDPETRGTKIERKDSSENEADQAPVAPKTARGFYGKADPSAEPFPSRSSDARPVSGKTSRATDRPGE